MGIWFLDNAFRFRRTDDLSDTAKRVSLDNDVIEGEYTVIETTNRNDSNDDDPRSNVQGKKGDT